MKILTYIAVKNRKEMTMFYFPKEGKMGAFGQNIYPCSPKKGNHFNENIFNVCKGNHKDQSSVLIYNRETVSDIIALL